MKDFRPVHLITWVVELLNFIGKGLDFIEDRASLKFCRDQKFNNRSRGERRKRGWLGNFSHPNPFAKSVATSCCYKKAIIKLVFVIVDQVESFKGRFCLLSYRLIDNFKSPIMSMRMRMHILHFNGLLKAKCYMAKISMHPSHIIELSGKSPLLQVYLLFINVWQCYFSQEC